jgi:23S rRNA (cytidine1920-2'-O)/16S rRNA (cytidine1409-2'-O)-methyltransferase
LKADKTRLDQALVERQLVDTRSRARALIMAGQVTVDGKIASKSGTAVSPESRVEVASTQPYVGRGGEKMAGALQATRVDPAGRICLDVGASTGGFTDCLLQHGAARVIAVDVGYGQLDWSLRNDPRVHVVERTNARYMEASVLPDDLPSPPDLVTMDLAFISVTKVLPAVGDVCADAAEALILVKPQFECGPAQVGSGGIVRRAEDRLAAARAVAAAATTLGWSLAAAVPSPLRGAAGNWECFLHLVRPPDTSQRENIEKILDSMEVPDDHDQKLD